MSVLKTAWANLQDGLGNRFSWSHVKAIFYNYAEQKLLSTKLDEMDALIDEKIAKAMMSNVQVNDQTKVPTSALAYSMNESITKLNSDLTGEVTIVVGTNHYSSLKRKGNICVAQIGTILTEFTPWQEAKIATVSYLPVSELQRNIVIYDTATGNAINGRLTLNILGEVSLYTTAPIPNSASLKECFTYICQ